MEEKAHDDMKAAALLCPSSEIGSSDWLSVVNYLAQARVDRLYLEAYAAAINGEP